MSEAVRSRAGVAGPYGVAVVVAVLLATFLLPWASPSAQAISCWLAVAAAVTGMTYYAVRVVRIMPDGTQERRFWKAVVGAGVAFGVTDWWQVVITLADPSSVSAQTGVTVIRTIGLGLGALILISVIVTFPVPHRSARERLCYHLDLATVVTAAGAVGLYGVIAGSSFAAGDVVGVAAGPVMSMLVAFVVGRLYLSGAAPFRWHIGLLGPIAGGLEAVARVLGPEMARSGRPGPVFAMSLGCHVLLLAAAWIQYSRYRSGHVAAPVARKRPYSLLPYVALTGIYGLLLTTLVLGGLDVRAWVIQIGAVICTGIVVARQLTAFIDNAQLLAERDSLTQRLHTMAFTDSLTGLANRACFLDRLHRAPGPKAVMLIDLDDFKPVNDSYGHAAGDAVLVSAADRLRASVGPNDLVARLGGDEFAVLFDEHRPEYGHPAVADRVISALGVPCRLPSGDEAVVRASAGLAVAAADHVLSLADQAMYRAKNRGKGSFEVAA